MVYLVYVLVPQRIYPQFVNAKLSDTTPDCEAPCVIAQ